MIYAPWAYQAHASDHIIENPAAGLFMEMGLGKTVATLTAINELMYERFEVSKVLVIAPKFVALNVWTGERDKWDHLKHLKIIVVTGTATQRIAALKTKADIHVINRENVPWLVDFYQTAWPFDMVVIDESSSFKNPQSQRFKSLRMVRPRIKRVVELTGTPRPNDAGDLWSQLYLLDQGERLGKTLTSFREAYMTAKRVTQQISKYEIRGDREEQEIYDRISDICISMKSADYLELPELIQIDRFVDFDKDLQKKYDDFEKDQVLKLAEEKEITAFNAGVLTGKLLQFASGAIYDAARSVNVVHDLKLEQVAEILEETGNEPVLLFYNFIHDRERILARFKNAVELKGKKQMDDWNKGLIPFMICHPKSAGHGLNLQDGGCNTIWFDFPWSLEEYQQANKRLHRQGQTKPVKMYRVIARETIDQNQLDVLDEKQGAQEALMSAVKAKIDFYLKNG